MTFFGMQAVYYGLTYIFGDTDLFSSIFQAKYIRHLTLVRIHSVAGSLAVFTSLAAVMPESLRYRWHRPAGRLYLMSVLVAGATSLPMASMAAGGVISKLGFGVQGLLWLLSAVLGAVAARRRDFALHRRLMIRSFALTFGAVLSRLLLNAAVQSGVPFFSVYDAVSWSWVLTVAAGELWMLSQAGDRGKR